MLQHGSIKILPLSKCISRDQELHSEKADKHVLHLEGNRIHVRNQQHDLASDLGNELKVHQAFIRGLASETANLAMLNMRKWCTDAAAWIQKGDN